MECAAVATDQPIGLDLFLRAVGVAQDRRHAGLRLREADRLDPALDGCPQMRQMLFEQPLGLRLRQHQRERIGARDGGKADVADRLVARYDVGARDLVARGDQRGAAPRTVEQFQRPAPEDQSLGLVSSLRRLVDDADRHAKARQLHRYRQADRTCADDQDLRDHFLSSPRPGSRHTNHASRPRKPGSVWPEACAPDATIHSSGDARFRTPLATNSGGDQCQRTGPATPRGGARRSYSVLLPAGLAVPPTLPPTRCALTAPFHPYPQHFRVCGNAKGGLLSVALSLGSPPPDVIRRRVRMEPGLSSARRRRSSGRLARHA